MIKEIKAKQILLSAKHSENWFNIKYNTNFYRGCPHKCICCDSRSECYQIENFNDIEVKINAPYLMEQELSKKRSKGVIGTGAMSDPYLPIEAKYQITRECLKVINKYNYPVIIITKSDLVLKDIDILKEINNKTKAIVIFTITTTDNELAKIIEPAAPSPKKRLDAMKELNKHGILTGALLMPALPFILDNENNIETVIKEVKNNNGKFIIPYFGVTLRDKQRLYYYQELDKHFPNIKDKYIKAYGNSYNCNSPKYEKLNTFFKETCNKYNIIYEMNKIDYYKEKNNQISFDFN